MQPTYLIGDATRPVADGPKVIIHIVNTAGRWGAGFVKAISRRWSDPEKRYRKWAKEESFKLGEVQFVQVDHDIWIANMVAQLGIGELNGPPIRYEALEQCLQKVAIFALEKGATVHAPRIGCGLAGGKWSKVGLLVEYELCNAGVGVFIYDLS